jgi:hypothetical protein
MVWLLVSSSSLSSDDEALSRAYDAARWAYQDGIGPHSSGRSGRGVVGCISWYTSCVQYCSFNVSWIQDGKEPWQSMVTVGTSVKRRQIFDREILPGGLWLSHAPFVIAASRDHVTGGAIRQTTYHLSNKIHLSCCNHVLDARDSIKHLSHSAIA